MFLAKSGFKFEIFDGLDPALSEAFEDGVVWQ